jgi:hypothetical protein
MNKFVIAAAYQWPDEDKPNKPKTSELAIKKIVEHLKARIDKNNIHKSGEEIRLEYKRLRGSAGKPILQSIFKRINECNALIVDISEKNPNVFIELGIAIARTKTKDSFSLYIIKEKKDSPDSISNKEGSEQITGFLADLPSDLQGYFITGYVNTKDGIVFKDQNSLLMSLVGNINDYYAKLNGSQLSDEINFSEPTAIEPNVQTTN